ncbi:MAG TPA: hypothetical protein VH482_33720, partial [Thermomicrobiales bacterium]
MSRRRAGAPALAFSALLVASRLAAQAPPLGGEFEVNTYKTGKQQTSAIAAVGGRGFVVVWVSDGQDGDGDGVFAQRFDGTGARSPGEFRVNTSTTGDQGNPAIASN